MKKTIIISVSLLLVIATSARVQDAGFSKSASLLNVGVGIGGSFNGFSSSVPISLSYEKGVADDISIGGQAAYAGTTVYGISVTAIYVGARASYHLGSVLKLPSTVDLYGGISVGYVIVSASDNSGDVYAASSEVGYGLYVGGKYFFSKKIGVFVEVGYQSLSTANAGLAFKF